MQGCLKEGRVLAWMQKASSFKTALMRGDK